MAEERERVRSVLHGCTEPGAPTTDPWPAIRERVNRRAIGPASGARTGEDRAAGVTRAETEGRPPSRTAANAPLALVLAVLSVLILGALIYAAASGQMAGPSRQGPPVGKPHGTEDGTGRDPDAHQNGTSGLETQVGQAKTANGMRVTLDWAYADAAFVAVGIRTQDLDGKRLPEATDPGARPATLEPALWDDTVGDESKLPPYVRITDASGQDFDLVGGGTLLGPDRTGARAVFDAPEGLRPGPGHRFRLEVPLATAAGGLPGEKPAAGPFVFEFEAPVRPAPTIEVNQEVQAKGVTLTLERVVDSPANPQAVICGVPDDEHRWMPWLEDQGGGRDELVGSPHKLGDGCWSLPMGDPLGEGRLSVTVERLEGMPTEPPDRAPSPGKTFSVKPKIIRGPWTFEFEAPGR